MFEGRPILIKYRSVIICHHQICVSFKVTFHNLFCLFKRGGEIIDLWTRSPFHIDYQFAAIWDDFVSLLFYAYTKTTPVNSY